MQIGDRVINRFNVGDPNNLPRHRSAGNVGVVEAIDDRGCLWVNFDGVWLGCPPEEIDLCLQIADTKE